MISKDAFFMIKGKFSQKWLGFSERGYDGDENRVHDINSPVLYNDQVMVNTFRFREAAYETVWDNYFLISSIQVQF